MLDVFFLEGFTHRARGQQITVKATIAMATGPLQSVASLCSDHFHMDYGHLELNWIITICKSWYGCVLRFTGNPKSSKFILNSLWIVIRKYMEVPVSLYLSHPFFFLHQWSFQVIFLWFPMRILISGENEPNINSNLYKNESGNIPTG